MLHHLTNALKRMPVALAATAASLLVVGAAAAAGTTWSAPEESSEQPAPEPTTVATIDTDSTVTSAVTAEADGDRASTPSGVAEAGTGGPAATEPTATVPPATEPATTEPAAIEPAATEPPATEPPATTEWHDTPVPQGIDLTCRADGTSVSCAWSRWDGEGFARYLLLRSDGSVGRVPFQTADASTTATIDTGLAAGSYSYVVIVLDPQGTTLVHSNRVTVQIGGTD